MNYTMSDRELSEVDELVEIESRTNSDGTVNVTIEGWEKVSSSRVEVRFQLIDTVKSEKMEWPSAGESFDNNKFKRLITSCGLDMRNADLLEGSDATAVKNGTSWELVVPDNTSIRERILKPLHNLLSSGWKWFTSLPLNDIIITVFWIACVVYLMEFVITAI